MTTQLPAVRRYELDWLRVLAFTLLIFYHTGMFFVSWPWHLKNNELSQSLQWPMLFVGQWRMCLIFLVSGAGVYLAMGHRPAPAFIRERASRILLPLAAGMLLVVPPQVYLERLSQGYGGSYLDFYATMLDSGPYPAGNFSWHHLWYLAYIFAYSVLLLPLLRYLRRQGPTLGQLKSWQLLLLPPAWLSLGEVWLRPLFPATNALYNDWANHFLYASVFLLGFMLLSCPDWQTRLQQWRRYSLALGLVLAAGLYAAYWLPEARPGGESLYLVVKTANRWCWLLAILGYAFRYLHFASPHLKPLNEMVFPFYILHQTVIVGLAYLLAPQPWPLGLKFGLIAGGTILLCLLLIHYIIKRINWLRPLFGLKLQARPAPAVAASLKPGEAAG